MSNIQTKATAPPLKFRKDIQGLRALAVLSVVGDHFFGWPRGGFVGVDVFFVLSGFLITGILLREHATDSFSFATFFYRRIRRIVPAAIATILVVTIAWWLVFLPPSARTVSWDALMSLGFVQNWNLVTQGTQYFSATGIPSPFQHYWSLSIEEQFYVVWPWLLVMAFAVRSRRRWILICCVLAVIVVVSFTYAVVDSENRPAWGYFATTSRVWELGLGAAAAMVPRKWLGARGLRVRRAVWCSSLLILLVACLALSSTLPFPGPWAVVPVLATCGLILSGPTFGRESWILENRGAQFVGRISYSLYLWHWPTVVFLLALFPGADNWLRLTALGLAIGLAWISYQYIERPLRRIVWVPRRWRGLRPRRQHHYDYALGAVALLSIIALTGAQFVVYPGSSARAQLSTTADEPFPSEREIQRSIAEALAAVTWPLLSPSIESLSRQDSALATVQDRNCISEVASDSQQVSAAMSETCIYGNMAAPQTLVVLGDSIAASWIPALARGIGQNWKIVGITFESCPAAVATVTDRSGRSKYPRLCDEARSAAFSVARGLNPAAVVLSSSLGAFDRQIDVTDGASQEREWMWSTQHAIAEFSPNSSVYVIESPPEGPAPSDCAMRVFGPANCTSVPGRAWSSKAAAERDAVESFSAASVSFVSTVDLFCSTELQCPIFADGTLIRIDRGHLTLLYSERVSAVLADRMSLPVTRTTQVDELETPHA